MKTQSKKFPADIQYVLSGATSSRNTDVGESGNVDFDYHIYRCPNPDHSYRSFNPSSISFDALDDAARLKTYRMARSIIL